MCQHIVFGKIKNIALWQNFNNSIIVKAAATEKWTLKDMSSNLSGDNSFLFFYP